MDGHPSGQPNDYRNQLAEEEAEDGDDRGGGGRGIAIKPMLTTVIIITFITSPFLINLN